MNPDPMGWLHQPMPNDIIPMPYSFSFQISFSHKTWMNPDPMGLLHQPMPNDLIPMPYSFSFQIFFEPLVLFPQQMKDVFFC